MEYTCDICQQPISNTNDGIKSKACQYTCDTYCHKQYISCAKRKYISLSKI